MPIRRWKNGAVIIYKGARYIVPAVIAGASAVIGFFAGKKWRKRVKGTGQQDGG